MIPAKRLPHGRASIKDLKSVSDVKEKASNFKSSDETKKLVKQAILQELNSHLMSVKPQIIHRKEVDSSAKQRKGPKLPLSKATKDDNRMAAKSQSYKGQRFEVEKHFEKPLSRIPRPISDVTNILQQPSVATNLKSKSVRVPGYDWDKKGRISELRTRYIARKYLTLWSRNVFGRVSPSFARQHYERKLMKNAFHTLEDLWWTSRKGWKLNIRAEYHNRYRIWKKAFKGWKLFLVYSKQKAVKKMIALKFDEMNSMKKAFLALTVYCKSRKSKEEQCKKADEQRNTVLKRFTLRKWLQMTLSSQRHRNLETQALTFWAYNITLRTYKTWIRAQEIKDIENKKLKLAKIHYDGVIASKCLESFRSYVLIRRRKQKIKVFADCHYQSVLKKRTIKIWYNQLQHQLEIKELEERIIFMARKFTLRTFYCRWKNHIEDVRCLKEKASIAEDHNNRQLKVTYFRRLKLAATRRCLKIERNLKADTFRRNKILTLHWGRWLQRCENSEELKIYPLTKIARAFCRKNRLKESLVQWWYYVSWRRKRKLTYAKADEHYKNVALPKYFARLLHHAEIRKEKNERKSIADDFSRELRYARSFYTWLKNSRMQQNLRMLERMAILQNEEACKRKTLMKWRAATNTVLAKRRKEDAADKFREQTLKRKYFSFFRKNLVEENTRRMHEKIAVQHDSKKTLSMVFLLWKTFTNRQVIKHRKTEVAEKHYKKVVLSKIMKKMKAYTEERKVVYQEVERRNKLHKEILLRWTFQRWRDNVNELISEKCKCEIAERAWTETTLKKIFTCWREYAVLNSHKKQQEELRVTELTKKLNHGKLRRAFESMKTFTANSKREKYQLQIAAEFSERRLKIKCMLEWKCFVALSFRKLLLQRQSLLFHGNKCLKSALTAWKNQFKTSMHEKNRTNVALWWWSQSLQRKVLFAWVDYVAISKENKRRVANALELRRNWMLENCVTRWFEYSSDMIAFRTKIAQARQMEGNVKLQERVRKYALIWYRKSKNSKREIKSRHEMAPTSNVDEISSKEPAFEVGMPSIAERNTEILGLPRVQYSQRPMPRKPDYLRDSYDLNLLLDTTSASSKDLQYQHSDESQPRIPPPEPQSQTRLQKHPLNRSKRNESIDFPASSEDDFRKDENEKSNSRKSRYIKTRIPEKDVLLLPPSSFEKLAKDKISQAFKSTPKCSNMAENSSNNIHVKEAIYSTRSPIDRDFLEENVRVQKNKEELSSNCEKEDAFIHEMEESSDSNEHQDADGDYDAGDTDEEEDHDYDDDDDQSVIVDENARLFNKISEIKANLIEYQEQQNRHKELESRYLYLSKWIDAEQSRRSKDELATDVDHQQALVLSYEMKEEMEQLSKELERRKPLVIQMAKNIKELAAKLNNDR